MEFNVAQLLKEDIGATRQYTVAECVTLPEEEQACWVEGEVYLLRTDKGVFASCSLETATQCTCSRCLTQYQHPLWITLEEEYLPTVDIVSGARIQAPDRDIMTIDECHILDLQEAFRQYLLVNLPMQPLCQPQCAGICPQCGAELNKGACACRAGRGGSRWTPLQNLRVAGQ